MSGKNGVYSLFAVVVEVLAMMVCFRVRVMINE